MIMPDGENVIINDIKITKKGRYALFCNDEFLFSIDEETLLKYHLKIGSALTPFELDSVHRDSDYFKAKDKALSFLDLRDHSENELYSKLCRSFDETTSAEVISRLKETGLIDDSSFAEKYFSELVRKKVSRSVVFYKMQEKEIPREVTESLMNNYGFDDSDAIRGIIDSRFLLKIKDETGRKKAITYLVNKGFRYRDVMNVISELINDFEEQNG